MLTAEQLAQFDEDGYLVLPGVLDDSDLDPVRAEYETVLDEAAEDLFASGDIASTYSDLPFDERYVKIITECPGVFYYLGISLPLDYRLVQPRWVRAHTGPALFGMISNPKILDIAESVLGPEVAANPVQQTRLKPPQRMLTGLLADYSNVGATTWHQDHGAVMDEAFTTRMLTVWIAMTDATEEMGCLVIQPGSHKKGELSLHCPGINNPAENYIPQAVLDMNERPAAIAPAEPGTVVLLNKFTEHGALTNESDKLRWSFDLRYQPIGEPTGRPAFPSTPLRSKKDPASVGTAESYAAAWEATRTRVLAGAVQGALYEQDRWLANRDNPVCA